MYPVTLVTQIGFPNHIPRKEKSYVMYGLMLSGSLLYM